MSRYRTKLYSAAWYGAHISELRELVPPFFLFVVVMSCVRRCKVHRHRKRFGVGSRMAEKQVRFELNYLLRNVSPKITALRGYAPKLGMNVVMFGTSVRDF